MKKKNLTRVVARDVREGKIETNTIEASKQASKQVTKKIKGNKSSVKRRSQTGRVPLGGRTASSKRECQASQEKKEKEIKRKTRNHIFINICLLRFFSTL